MLVAAGGVFFYYKHWIVNMLVIYRQSKKLQESLCSRENIINSAKILRHREIIVNLVVMREVLLKYTGMPGDWQTGVLLIGLAAARTRGLKSWQREFCQ